MEKVSKKFILAVDGPAGTGKSSVCKAVSEELNWGYFNTGAIYRGVALVGKALELDLTVEAQAIEAAKCYTEEAIWDLSGKVLKFRDQDLAHELGCNETAQNASYVAKNTAIRKLLLPVQVQKATAAPYKGVVVEGRDIGTVVFPEASLKIFLTASLETRTKRRQSQLESSNQSKQTSYENLAKTISSRDKQDSQRQSAPMTKAVDAVEVDTSDLSLQQVKDKILSMISLQS